MYKEHVLPAMHGVQALWCIIFCMGESASFSCIALYMSRFLVCAQARNFPGQCNLSRSDLECK